MPLATVPSATLVGIEGRPVTVTAHVSDGLPGFTVVGMPDGTCREARDRTRAALLASGFRWPDQRITVSLTPPGLRKQPAGLDLPIALAVLAADGQLDARLLEGHAAVGELGLDGSLRGVPGGLSLVEALTATEVLLPPAMLAEAQHAGRHTVHHTGSLGDVVRVLTGELSPPAHPAHPAVPPNEPDLPEISCHPADRYALEVAAAGAHHLLMVNHPRAERADMARYLAGILPPLTDDEARETTKAHSAAGHPLPPDRLLRQPTLRSPGHDASAVALLGGGTEAMLPGELSLANWGVLFLDELSEFSPVVLENLRQPIEEGIIHITRTTGTATFPAHCLLVGALHACPCRASGPQGACSCSPGARARYSRRLPVRLLDRFDLRIDHLATDTRHQPGNPSGESTQAVRERVTDARQRARQRDVTGNAQLSTEALENIAPLDHKATRTIERALSEGALTGSGLTNVHRIALTIADLAGDEPPLDVDHVATALALRAHLAHIAGRVV